MTDAPYTQPVGSGDTDEKPIKLGGALFTMVEPHPGHEVAYNRWYERDHFYAGCMIGAYTVAGARYVATRECKAKRYPTDSAITPDPMIGSYLALYWILAGHFDDWMRWGTDQVNWLHANGRMFTDRDHIHTLMYELADERSEVDMPAELALDRPFGGVVATIGELTDGTTIDQVVAWYRQRPAAGEVDVTLTPKPLFDDAPGDVPRDTVANRFLRLTFVTESPLEVWDDRFAGEGAALADSGLGQLVFASPFLATVPGTDTYTDQLR
jgi:hypothetical protein